MHKEQVLLTKGVFSNHRTDKQKGGMLAKPVYINGVRYRSMFIAGIDSDICYVSISQHMQRSKGAPVVVHGCIVMTEEWLLNNLFFLFIGDVYDRYINKSETCRVINKDNRLGKCR